MSTPRAPRRAFISRGNLFKVVAVVVVLAAFIVAAIVSAGFDVKQVPVNSSSVWVLQAGAQGNRYGQVNTQLSELSSANSIYQPEQLVQSRAGVLIYTSGLTRFANVNAASPAEFTDDETLYQKAPPETKNVEMAGSTLAYIAGTGELLMATVEGGVVSDPSAVPLSESQVRDNLTFDAVAVVDGGSPETSGPPSADVIYGFSHTTGRVYRYTPGDSSPTEVGAVTGAGAADDFELSVFGDTWVLVDASTSTVWVAGRDAAGTSFSASAGEGAHLQKSSRLRSDFAYIAGSTGLASVALGSGAVAGITQASGVAARPVSFQGAVYAAWLGESATGGTLYSSLTGQTTPLTYGGKALTSTPTPVINLSDSAAAVNDTTSGWAWNLPTGALIPSTQNWSLVDRTPDQTSAQAEEQKVTTPKPPVAESDSFGVRAGDLVTLPVMLNDHDPNPGDVLTIDPASVSGLDGGFGVATVASNEQVIVVSVSGAARGSASFSYRVSDGTAVDGLMSNSATVRLNIVDPGQNSGPARCADVVDGCVYVEPLHQVIPGGTVSIPGLDGWVDPDGDRFFVNSVSVPGGKGSAGFTSSGDIVYQNDATGAPAGTSVVVTATLSDTRGATSQRIFNVTVAEDPVLEFTGFSVTAAVDQPMTVDIARAVSGASGEVVLRSANKSATSDATIDIVSDTAFRIESGTVEQVLVQVVVADSTGETTGEVRVNVVNPDSTQLSTTPVTVLVSSGLDTTVDLFAAAHNPSGRALVVSDIATSPLGTAALFADPINAGFVRVRGASAEGLPGLLGTFSYTLSDGTDDARFRTTGVVSVYQMEYAESQAPIGVPDAVTVRAGSTTNVDVLANDVGLPGVPLVVSASSLTSDCMPGGLLFAGGGKVRVVAPSTAGDYRCSYALFSAGNPTQQASTQLTIHVVAPGSNRKPAPRDLYGRVNAGSSVKIPVDLQNIDPDGDSVQLISVSQTSAGKGFASINDERNAIVYISTPDESGQDSLTYTVKDAQGDTATASVRVGITNADFNPAPVTMTDYVEIVAGPETKALVNPLNNDIDPRGEAMTLVEDSVVPDLSPGSSLYTSGVDRVTKIDGNVITFAAGDTPSTMVYRYTVKNASGSRSTGSIVVRVASQAATYSPEVLDTYVSMDQRDQLPSGIDVVTQKVAWSSGDIGSLTLSIWGDGHGFTASGHTIRGTAPPEGAVVVFTLEGKDFAGTPVSGYGLLHVPGIRDIVLTIDPDKARQQVNENSSVQFDIADLVTLPATFSVDVDSGNTRALGQRDNGKCSVSGTRITYDAGSGAPWRDGCIVPIRVAGSSTDFVSVLIPVTVIPANPEPELTRTQLTVVPDKSQTTTFVMTDMTTWYGHTDLTDLTYSFSYTGNYFTVTQDGQSLIISSTGSAPTGAREMVTISVSNHPATTPAPLVLVVGAAVNDGPQGGHIEATCQADKGPESCTISVSAITDAYNPTPDVPLVFAPFNFAGGNPDYQSGANEVNCGTAKLAATEQNITVSFSSTPVSVHCSNIVYRVIDKTGKSGRGVLDFRILGIPSGPRSVIQSDYSESTITLEIQAGLAAEADPVVTTYIVVEDGHESECARSGTELTTTCELAGLGAYDGRSSDSGDLHTYQVYAKNDVGRSEGFAEVTNAYAYRAPSAITADIFSNVSPTFDRRVTSASLGLAAVTITPKQDDVVSAYLIQGDGGTQVRHELNSFGQFTENISARPGMNSTITVSAVGRTKPPVSGPNTATPTASWSGRIIGAPTIASSSASASLSASTWRSVVQGKELNRNFSNKPLTVAFATWQATSSDARCSWDFATNVLTVSGDATTISKQMTLSASDNQIDSIVESELAGLVTNKGYTAKVCVSNGFGIAEAKSPKYATVAAPKDGELTYAVSATPTPSGNGGSWQAKLVSTLPAGTTAEFSTDLSVWDADLARVVNVYGKEFTVHARYCILVTGSKFCSSDNGTLSPADETRAWQLSVTGGFETDSSGVKKTSGLCEPGARLYFDLTGSGLTGSLPRWIGAKPRSGVTTAKYRDGSGLHDMQSSLGNFKIPLGTTGVREVHLFILGNPEVGPVSGLTGSLEVVIPCA